MKHRCTFSISKTNANKDFLQDAKLKIKNSKRVSGEEKWPTEIWNVNVSRHAMCEMVIIVFRRSPISLQCVRKESDELKTGMRGEKERWEETKPKTKLKTNQKESQKSVHVNITLPLSQIRRRIQVSHWYYCRYKAPAEEIKTIKSLVQSQVKTERERKRIRYR